MSFSTRRPAVIAIVFFVSLPACGGKSPTQSSGSSSGTNIKTLTATITPTPTSQGQQVAAPTAFVGANVTGALLATGVLGIAGTNGGTSLNINLVNIPLGPGTYNLAGGANGGLAGWVGSNGVFNTQTGTSSGSIILTTATLARITGTFSFVANDIPDGNPAQKRVVVSNGAFDITVP